MPLFDRYIAVDWSANNTPKRGKDSIWIADRRATGEQAASENPPTREAAMAILVGRLDAALAAGERVLLGFDFPFGHPSGAALATVGQGGWEPLWAGLHDSVEDAADNRSNRFSVAAMFNHRLAETGARFWGCPAGAAGPHLSPRKVGACFERIAEFRHVERVARGAKSTWQLHYNGSVGSQCLLGLARLEALRRHPSLGRHIAVWPYQTDFDNDLDAPIVLAEIYPSLIRTLDPLLVRDRAQVEAQVRLFAELDAAGRLRQALSFPPDMDTAIRRVAQWEEGWIVGAGHAGLAA